MRGQSRQFGVQVWACCAMVGAAGIAGLIGGLSMRASQLSHHQRTEINLSAAEVISFRFPNDWHDGESASEDTAQTAATAASAPTPARYAVASATSMPVVFNPKPMHEAVAPAPVLEPEPAPPWIMAAIPPLPKPRPNFEASHSTAAATAANTATAPIKHAAVAPKPKAQSNAVLNGAQIASIKRRLNLSPDQERYWPAVEAELRKMEYKKDSKGTRTAAIDTSKMNVEGLRNAGFPLVMSFSDDQRRELKSLAHLLGLEGAMSGL